jgi:hypothetical protein
VSTARTVTAAEFVSLCERLRELGAVKVSAGEFFAQWPPAKQAAIETAPPVVTRVQLGPKPKPVEEQLTVHEGEQLSEADKERRRGYRRLAELEGGS